MRAPRRRDPGRAPGPESHGGKAARAPVAAEDVARESEKAPRANTRAPGLVLGAVVALAAIPAVLVTLDRFAGVPAVHDLLRGAWARLPLLESLALPPYFLLIFACVPLGAALVLVTSPPVPPAWLGVWTAPAVAAVASPRRAKAGRAVAFLGLAGAVASCLVAALHDRLPGWELCAAYAAFVAGLVLRDDTTAWRERWRRGVEAAAPLLIAAVALLTFLASAYGDLRFRWVTAVLLAVAGANLWLRRASVPAIGWIVLGALALFASNMNAWWLSAIGDEYAFYFGARNIVERQTWSQIDGQLFGGQMIYEAHPYFSSLIQAGFMSLFGTNGFGWRIGNPCLSAAAVGLLYLFLRRFVARRVALHAAAFLAVSHYLMSFGKIGYNNLQALFAEALVLAAAARAVSVRREASYAALGGAVALCFYVYPAALYVVPLPFFLLLLYDPPRSRDAVGRWCALAVATLVLLYPLLVQPGYWSSKVAGTLYYDAGAARLSANPVPHLLTNLVYSAFGHLFVPHEQHYVAVGYVDPLTAVLVGIGLAGLAAYVAKRRFAAFMLASFAALLVLVGATHDRTFPPATRMFLLLPSYAFFAASGVAWIGERAPRFSRAARGGAVALLFGVLALLNLYQAYPLARDRMSNIQDIESLCLRLMQRAGVDGEGTPRMFAFLADDDWPSTGIRWFLDVYPVRARFLDVRIRDGRIPPADEGALADPNTLVIARPAMAPGTRAAVARRLAELGKKECEVRSTGGDARFTLWLAPGLARLCEPGAGRS